MTKFVCIVVSPVVDTGGQLVAMATPVSYCRGCVHQSLLAQTGEQHTTPHRERMCTRGKLGWPLSLPPSLSLSLFLSFPVSLSLLLPFHITMSSSLQAHCIALTSLSLPSIHPLLSLSLPLLLSLSLTSQKLPLVAVAQKWVFSPPLGSPVAAWLWIPPQSADSA